MRVIHAVDTEGNHRYCYELNEAGGWASWVEIGQDDDGNPYLRICEGEVSVTEPLPNGCTLIEARELARQRAEDCALYWERKEAEAKEDDDQ